MKIASKMQPGAIYLGAQNATPLAKLLAEGDTLRSVRIALIEALVDPGPVALEIARLDDGAIIVVDDGVDRPTWTGVALGVTDRPSGVSPVDILAAVVERLGPLLRSKVPGESLSAWTAYVGDLGADPFGYLAAGAFGYREAKEMAAERALALARASRNLRLVVTAAGEITGPDPDRRDADTPAGGLDVLISRRQDRDRPVLLLIDGNNVVHRLFHGRPMTTDAKGPNNALRGWESTIRRLREEVEPDFAVAVFDGDGKNWRHELFPSYKAARKPTPDDLLVQWPRVYEECDRTGLRWVRRDGWEADDVIASYCQQALNVGCDVLIVSNDKDLLQLARDIPVSVRRLTSEGQRQGPEYVMSKYGVDPERLVDILALAGDASDGIPGAPGVGLVKAQKFITEYGTLEGAIRRSMLLSSAAARAVHDNASDLRIYKRLVSLRFDLPIPIPIKDASW